MEDPQYLRNIDVPNQSAAAAQFVFNVSRLRHLTRIRAIRFTATVAAARERINVWLRATGRPNTERWTAPVVLSNSTGSPDECSACIGGPPFVERVVTGVGVLIREDIAGSHLAALPDVWFDQNIIVEIDTDPTSGQALITSVRLQVEDIDVEPLPMQMMAALPPS